MRKQHHWNLKACNAPKKYVYIYNSYAMQAHVAISTDERQVHELKRVFINKKKTGIKLKEISHFLLVFAEISYWYLLMDI